MTSGHPYDDQHHLQGGCAHGCHDLGLGLLWVVVQVVVCLLLLKSLNLQQATLRLKLDVTPNNMLLMRCQQLLLTAFEPGPASSNKRALSMQP